MERNRLPWMLVWSLQRRRPRSIILEFLSGIVEGITRTYAKVTRVAWRSRCENVWLRDISRWINGVIFLFSRTRWPLLLPPVRRRSYMPYTFYFILFYFILFYFTKSSSQNRVNHTAHELPCYVKRSNVSIWMNSLTSICLAVFPRTSHVISYESENNFVGLSKILCWAH